MKSSLVAGLVALTISIPIQAVAQTQSLASTIDVYVFPTEGQDSNQQSTDEAACYEWAVSNTGSDPFNLARQQQADAQRSQAELEAAREVGRGAGAGGLVGGAATGALIGEIANDDAGEGAAWGAGLGAIASRRAARHAREQATAETTRQAESRATSTAEQTENFKKAFSVCLEAKKYLVKY